MTLIEHFLGVAAHLQSALVVNETTLSYRIFADSKRLKGLREGNTITVRRLQEAVAKMLTEWPNEECPPELHELNERLHGPAPEEDAA